MLTRLIAFLRNLLQRVAPARTGRRLPPYPGSSGGGMREPVEPRVPVLSGAGARAYPPDDER